MSEDRRSKIYHDQIEDHTLTPDELDIVNYQDAKKLMVLMFTDEGSGSPKRFRWKYWIRGRIF